VNATPKNGVKAAGVPVFTFRVGPGPNSEPETRSSRTLRPRPQGSGMSRAAGNWRTRRGRSPRSGQRPGGAQFGRLLATAPSPRSLLPRGELCTGRLSAGNAKSLYVLALGPGEANATVRFTKMSAPGQRESSRGLGWLAPVRRVLVDLPLEGVAQSVPKTLRGLKKKYEGKAIIVARAELSGEYMLYRT
jgi:hypothetical protein